MRLLRRLPALLFISFGLACLGPSNNERIARDGSLLGLVCCDEGGVVSLAIRPNSPFLATGGSWGSVSLSVREEKWFVTTRLATRDQPLGGVVFLPDGSLVAGYMDGSLMWWQVDGRSGATRLVRELTLDGGLLGVVAGPGEGLLAYGGGGTYAIDTNGEALRVHGPSVGAAVSSSRATALVIDRDGGLWCLHAPKGGAVGQSVQVTGGLPSWQVAPLDSEAYVSWSGTEEVLQRVDCSPESPSAMTISVPFDLEFRGMAATESGLVAIAGASGQVLLVDLVSERVLFELQLRSVAPHLAFSPSGLQLGTGEISGRFSIWSVESGEVVGGFGFKVAIVSLAVDESGEVWIYGRVDGTTVVWDL